YDDPLTGARELTGDRRPTGTGTHDHRGVAESGHGSPPDRPGAMMITNLSRVSGCCHEICRHTPDPRKSQELVRTFDVLPVLKALHCDEVLIAACDSGEIFVPRFR